MAITPAQAGIDPQYLPSSFVNSAGELTVSSTQAKEVAAGIQARATTLPAGEQAIFLSLVKSPDFSPPGDINASDLSSALNRFEKAAHIIQEFSASTSPGDSSRILARLMVELAGLQRKDALNNRLALRQQARSELESQADQLETAGKEAASAAMMQMCVSIGAAAFSFAASSISLGGALKNASKLKELKSAIPKADGLDGAPNMNGADKLGKAADIGDAAGASTASGTSKVGKAGKAAEATEVETFELKLTIQKTKSTTGADGAPSANARDPNAAAANDPATPPPQQSPNMTDPAGNTEFQLGLRDIGVREAKIQGASGLAGAIGGAGNGIAAGAASGHNLASKEAEADAARDAADAELTKSYADLSAEAQQSLNDMMKTLINFIKEMLDAEVGQMTAITRG
ncbi:hypothetical protein C8N35_111135 [Breoghania corrubedonensis]|uniref:Uncharacterized protein n=1 Tax=Breoghania corrubedonensis TaxID=665038 RepID=A0A2T5UYU7_9HYPH|nr:hypothetical protein [Breoghania corrubedonensis]PTW56672.1 hypothetical protein C8N35_111135 [Breoghania corrubedonensis]